MSISTEILVNNKPVDTYYHNNQTYIEGRKGSSYVIRIKNLRSDRKKIVVSVDGLNVISGDNDWTKGYVIGGHEIIDIPGWLKNDQQAAKFVFSDVKKSYNQHNLSGNVNNVGVIGVLVYDEQPVNQYIPLSGQYRAFGEGGSSDGIGSFSGILRSSGSVNNINQLEQQSVGTGWGKATDFKTTSVSFNANSYQSQTVTIFYDSRKGLESRGIVLNRVKNNPNPFPGYAGYCPEPH